MVTSLKNQLNAIEAELLLIPKDLSLLKSQMEVENKLEISKFKLTDVPYRPGDKNHFPPNFF